MKQNQREKAREWSPVFSEWRRSGGSQRGYCWRNGISISAFGYWLAALINRKADELGALSV